MPVLLEGFKVGNRHEEKDVVGVFGNPHPGAKEVQWHTCPFQELAEAVIVYLFGRLGGESLSERFDIASLVELRVHATMQFFDSGEHEKASKLRDVAGIDDGYSWSHRSFPRTIRILEMPATG